MSLQAAILSARINSELFEIKLVVERTVQAWDKATRHNDDFYLDSVALKLHAFYSGLERIFEKLASTIDGSVPTAANWHQELLTQMQTEILRITWNVGRIPTLHKMLNSYSSCNCPAKVCRVQVGS